MADTVSEGNGRHEFFMGFGSVGVHNLFALLEVSEVTVFHKKEDQFRVGEGANVTSKRCEMSRLMRFLNRVHFLGR